jgi:uncharacterized protein YjbI with pentapeptide repeats
VANTEHLSCLNRMSAVEWNRWREERRGEKPDLSFARLSGWRTRTAPGGRDVQYKPAFGGFDLEDSNLHRADFGGMDLYGAYLNRALLTEANLDGANLEEANLVAAHGRHATLKGSRLRHAKLYKADLSYADLSGAYLAGAEMRAINLTGADLRGANLMGAQLQGADLTEARLDGARLDAAELFKTNLSRASLRSTHLQMARLIDVDVSGASLAGSNVYGIAVWNLTINDATDESNLVITKKDEPSITVDSIEIAQFIYLLLNNRRIRRILDSIVLKVVLILGRFSRERKAVLDAIREELRKHNYSPVLFDFEKPNNRDVIETVSTLAHLARFVIADVTDPRIVLEEVPHIVRNIAVPVKPVLLAGSQSEPLTLEGLRRNHRSLLDTFAYVDAAHLVTSLAQHIIAPAEAMAACLSGPGRRV